MTIIDFHYLLVCVCARGGLDETQADLTLLSSHFSLFWSLLHQLEVASAC